MLIHACAGFGEMALVLAPDDLPLPDAPADGRQVIVTGTYTGRDARANGAPAPVGLTVARGRAIGRNLAPMDGILVIEPRTGRPRLHAKDAVPLAGQTHDLTTPWGRARFLDAAAAAGVSVLQSHLVVIDRRVDTRPVPEAPRARRRILYTRGDAFGIWQSDGALTLDEAARLLDAEIDPDMALNLDMGSHDFCLDRRGDDRRACGYNPSDWRERLSTLLVVETPG